MAKSGFELYQLRCFVAVAEELNFRRAAERLNMTQPPLSRQIQMLEQAVGESLLERNNRAVRLTPAGESFLVSAGDLLQRAERAALTARQAARGEAGGLALGFVPSAGIEFVPRLVCAVRDSLPNVGISPSEMMSYEINESLLSGRLDMGLTRTARRHAEIESTLVVSEPFVLAVPSSHRLASVPQARLADIDGEPFIGYSADRGGFLREIHGALFGSEGIEPSTVMEVSQTTSVLALVNYGVGVAVVPQSAQAVSMANLTFRQIETPDRFRSTLYLTAGPKRRDLPLYQRLRQIVLEALSPFR
ncbi:LysR substrate-binding domain-containing protein [Antarctobacter jejuensis]|uniref:LysR substrate-binding domain-containing protein n=1 Tax=Antarctobacter jejuensis TaxID=1439938 RepID=UPI003FD37E05